MKTASKKAKNTKKSAKSAKAAKAAKPRGYVIWSSGYNEPRGAFYSGRHNGIGFPVFVGSLSSAKRYARLSEAEAVAPVLKGEYARSSRVLAYGEAAGFVRKRVEAREACLGREARWLASRCPHAKAAVDMKETGMGRVCVSCALLAGLKADLRRCPWIRDVWNTGTVPKDDSCACALKKLGKLRLPREFSDAVFSGDMPDGENDAKAFLRNAELVFLAEKARRRGR